MLEAFFISALRIIHCSAPYIIHSAILYFLCLYFITTVNNYCFLYVVHQVFRIVNDNTHVNTERMYAGCCILIQHRAYYNMHI